MEEDSTLDSSTLALSDIMLPVSPVADHQELRSGTPGPAQEPEVILMHQRITEMGLSDTEAANASSREKELVDMILRLTDISTRPDPDQLVRQAEAISSLAAQRDFLIMQAEQERARWESERDGWARMAEALIAQRIKVGSSVAKDEELERQRANFESDNKALREKLNDTQSRLISLESELLRLRPILLMQPLSFSTSQQPSSSAPAHPSFPGVTTALIRPLRGRRSKKEKEKDRDKGPERDPLLPSPTPVTASVPEGFVEHDHELTEEEIEELTHTYDENDVQAVGQDTNTPNKTEILPSAVASSSKLSPATLSLSSGHYRRTETVEGSITMTDANSTPNVTTQLHSKKARKHTSGGSTDNKVKRTKPNPSTPLLSDARSEHLLLAARRIGRERAGIVAGLVNKDKEKERQRERDEMVMTAIPVPSGPPKTPKRGAMPIQQYTHTSPRALNPGFVFLTSPVHPNPNSTRSPTVLVPMPPGGYQHLLHTPARVQGSVQLPTPAAAQRKNPPTPLDSLLSAAQSMMNDDGAGGSSNQGASVDKVNGRGTGRTRRASTIGDIPESPIPKRRKIAASSSPGRGESSAGAGRVKSALDVLADQAAAFSSQGGSEKGKEKANPNVDQGRGKTSVTSGTKRTRAKAALKEKSKSNATAKKPRVAESDLGSVTPRMISPPQGFTATKDNDGRNTQPPEGVPKQVVATSKPSSLGTGREKGKGREVDTGDHVSDRVTPVEDLQHLEEVSIPSEGRVTRESNREDVDSQVRSIDNDAETVSPGEVFPESGSGLDKRRQDGDIGEENDQGVQGTPNQPHMEPALELDNPPPLSQAVRPSSPSFSLLSNPVLDIGEEWSIPPFVHTFPPSPSRQGIPPDVPQSHLILPPALPSSSSLANALAPPINVSRSRSEDRREHPHQENQNQQLHFVNSRRATSIPSSQNEGSESMPFLRWTNASEPIPEPMDSTMGVFDSSLVGDTIFASNPDMARVGGQEMQMTIPGKRPRSPYIKWSKEEDDLLAQAVAKYGQKWDLVQKALPSRGYHQVRQRWLRKLGVFDSKPDLSSYQGSFSPSPGSGSRNPSVDSSQLDPPPNPKLGMAPLSSEIAFSTPARSSGLTNTPA